MAQQKLGTRPAWHKLAAFGRYCLRVDCGDDRIWRLGNRRSRSSLWSRRHRRGADQMARLLQGVITKNNLMKQPLIVVNKSGGAGAEGFLSVKEAKGDPHKIIITLSNLFTTPLATGVPFSWKDMTPVAMLALDNFVLWVNSETPYKTAKEYLDAVKAGGPNKFKMGGTGSKQEDQIITVAIEKAIPGVKFIYVPFKGGGDVAVQLVGKHIDSTVNNPIEAVAQWRAGQLRALCVF